MKEISTTKALRLRRGSPKKSDSWGGIVQRYAHLVEKHHSYEPMLNLVRTLVSSPAAKELYPHTWMFRLVIANENEWYDDDNLLTIEYDCYSHKFTFEH